MRKVRKSIKERAAILREQQLKKDGRPYYVPCTTCNLDCDRIMDKQKTSIHFVTCPKMHPKGEE